MALVSFQKHDEIALTNIIMFLKTNLGNLSQITLKNMQLLALILHYLRN